MMSIDTNILFPAVEITNPDHPVALAFMDSVQDREDVAISEFVLLELYVLLRNPVVMPTPMKASAAVDVCETFRRHPRWQIIGFPSESRPFHDELWPKLRVHGFARRRAFDLRLSLSLTQQGVADFATVNVKDFQGMGFRTVWNPLHPAIP